MCSVADHCVLWILWIDFLLLYSKLYQIGSENTKKREWKENDHDLHKVVSHDFKKQK